MAAKRLPLGVVGKLPHRPRLIHHVRELAPPRAHPAPIRVHQTIKAKTGGRQFVYQDYQLSLKAPLQLGFAAWGWRTDVDLELLDADGSLITSDASSGMNSDPYIEQSVTPGRYTVRVKHGSGSNRDAGFKVLVLNQTPITLRPGHQVSESLYKHGRVHRDHIIEVARRSKLSLEFAGSGNTVEVLDAQGKVVADRVLRNMDAVQAPFDVVLSPGTYNIRMKRRIGGNGRYKLRATLAPL